MTLITRGTLPPPPSHLSVEITFKGFYCNISYRRGGGITLRYWLIKTFSPSINRLINMFLEKKLSCYRTLVTTKNVFLPSTFWKFYTLMQQLLFPLQFALVDIFFLSCSKADLFLILTAAERPIKLCQQFLWGGRGEQEADHNKGASPCDNL